MFLGHENVSIAIYIFSTGIYEASKEAQNHINIGQSAKKRIRGTSVSPKPGTLRGW